VEGVRPLKEKNHFFCGFPKGVGTKKTNKKRKFYKKNIFKKIDNIVVCAPMHIAHTMFVLVLENKI